MKQKTEFCNQVPTAVTDLGFAMRDENSPLNDNGLSSSGIWL